MSINEQPPLDPLRDPLSEQDVGFLGKVVLSLLCAMLLFVGWHRLVDRPLVDADDMPHRPLEFRVDLNSADWAELAQLPGVGPTLAQRIIDHRQQTGPFARADELTEVHGIGEKKLARMRPYLLPLPGSRSNAAEALQVANTNSD